MIKRLEHVGVVYKDFSEVAENIKDLYGIPKIDTVDAIFDVYNNIKGMYQTVKIKIGFARFGEYMLELFQPLDDKSIYSEFLKTNPEGGIHHVGIVVENIDEELKKWDNKGIPRMISGFLPSNRFVYYDTREIFGYATEIRDEVPPSDEMLKEFIERKRRY